MKSLIAIAALASFGIGLAGCHASIDTDSPSRTSSTDVDRNGNKSVETTKKYDANGNLVERKTEVHDSH